MPTYTQRCVTCGSQTPLSGGQYGGRNIPLYDMFACKICIELNEDGWGPLIEPAVVAHADAHGIALPQRNGEGLLPLGL